MKKASIKWWNYILFAEFMRVAKSLKFKTPSLSRSAFVNMSWRFSCEIVSSNFSNIYFKSSIEIEPSPSYQIKINSEISELLMTYFHEFMKRWIQFLDRKLEFELLFKGQLISKCPYENSVSSKIPTKIWISALKFLVASWGLPGDLVSNIINKEAYRKPKKLPGSSQEATKNFRTEIQK